MLKFALFFIFIVLNGHFKRGYGDEPKCTSKFDYDYKMLQKMVELEEKVHRLEQQQAKMSTDGAGAVYVRWGKTICHEDASLIYKGYTAGKKYSEKGGGSDSLCLPSDPSWFNYTHGFDTWRGRIYGAETDVFEDILPYSVAQQDMPCAVCRSHRSAVLMIPGRTSCYPGWRQEYSGYLMAGHHSNASPQSYICVDSHPDFVPKGSGNDNQHILYLVECVCGSLPCPPYVQGQELACVVCTICNLSNN